MFNSDATSIQAGTMTAFIEQARKKKPCHTYHVDGALSEDELNTTTLFTVNVNARFARDGSLQYADFRALPLTPTTLRKTSKASSPDDDNLLLMTASRRQLCVPPLDLSNLRGSHESVSFAPYTARMRSTDTVVTTERLLPPIKEEKSSRLQTVIDTELALPLTPTTLRKTSKASSPDDDNLLLMTASRRQLCVPPLDLSNLRGSHESVSFAPYTARMRSTDTVVTTERLLPPIKEEKSSRLQTVIDTEL
ncbi:hypothetical protein DPMN_170681 [Dreissena polymorpha]|uniref:Uncharacterized protein n=1 Tax=Dreissena polymorpha TaxID=45954 RepID=A0A9D4IET0_DREPO|nr:hypothetical protein DPMN_170681 [Dreissena polymorpha]